LAGIAFPLAHPQRAVGLRPVRGHGAAVAAALPAGLDRVVRDLDLVPLSHRARLAQPQGRPADARAPVKARDMSASPHTDPDCLFCKIAAGQIPSRKVLEDDDVYVFHDIAPWA